MSQVSGDKQTTTATGPSGRPPRSLAWLAAAPRAVRLAWLPAIVALIVMNIAIGASAVSCGEGTDNYPGLDGGEGLGGHSPGCIGATCPAACAAHPGPGCACGTEGSHLSCGTVEGTYPAEGTSPAQTVCGLGFSVCTGGVWSPCVLTGANIVVPNAPPGFYTQGLGAQAACANNPCDPSCQDFPDTPTGLDAGSGLQITDAGVTLNGNGTPPCTPATCQGLGYNCGVQSDGCGHALNCGTCIYPQTCGGGGHSSVCGVNGSCTGYCLNQVLCGDGGTTSISGITYMPNGVTPLPNVLVYVPNSNPAPFVTSSADGGAAPACVNAANCNAEVSGNPLVATTSNVDGTFTLSNVPVNVSFPVVLQLGRFRRQFTMPAVSQCSSNPITCTASNTGACLTRFARKQAETSPYDNIPKMAFSTGAVDALECVWIKVGIDATDNLYGTSTGEFTAGNSAGRINLYYGGTNGGAFINTYGSAAGQTPQFEVSVLDNPSSVLSQYDMVMFPCQGAQGLWPAPYQVNRESAVANYVNAGGRVFTTHFSYIWIYSDSQDLGLACRPNGAYADYPGECCSLTASSNICVSAYSSPLSPALVWSVNQSQSYGNSSSANADINQGFPAGATLAKWLFDIHQSSPLGTMSINTIRHSINGVVPPGEEYVSLSAAATVNLNTDPGNCGSCGNVCNGGTPLCSNGACAASCPTGFTQCAGNWCANLQQDQANCGVCGVQCNSGEACNHGVCGCGGCAPGEVCNSSGTCQCPTGLTYCGGYCSTLATDPNNCGACGNSCGSAQACVLGVCSSCPVGTTACNGACIDTAYDPSNCGACGNPCNTGIGQQCVAGVCKCGAGTTLCGGNCVAPNWSTTYCGTSSTVCGTACTGGKKCQAGTCIATCGTGYHNCNGACNNYQTDINNCGACNKVCTNGQTCVAGTCTFPTGYTKNCSGAAEKLLLDDNNCGSCGTVCPGGSTCVAGVCTAQVGYQVCINGNGDLVTVSTLTDPKNCGGCGNRCTGGKGCTAGLCACPAGTTACSSGVCANLLTDTNNCGVCNKVCASNKACSAGACVASTQISANTDTCAIPQQASFNSGDAGLGTPTGSMCGRVVFSDFHVENASNTQVAFPSECSFAPDGGIGAFSPQEAMLAQALFDLAGCVSQTSTTTCTPTTCLALGVGCGTTGDGCGGMLNCGTCPTGSTCGGSGVLNQCGIPATFSAQQFVRQYTATCSNNQHPIWRGYWWGALTPSGSTISFQIATASTLTGLSTATPVALQWSAAALNDAGNPPGLPGVPQGYSIGQPAIAQSGSAGPPVIANTDIWGASPDATLLANGLPQNNNYLEVIATLTPSGGGAVSPTLASWDMQIDCVDNE